MDPEQKPQSTPDTLPPDSELFDDVKPTTTTSTPAQPSLLKQAGTAALDAFTGVGKGFASTANNLGHIAMPDFALNFANKHLGTHIPVPTAEQQESYFKPQGTMQSIGKGAEQVGEFFLPGGAEEAGGEKLASALPKIGRFAKPLARIAGGEAVNEAQGGTPGVGAAGGAAGEAVGAGLRSLAPYAAETAMRIPPAARAFSRTPGKAILEDTVGIRPSTVGRTAQGTIARLTPEVEQAADAASTRANRLRGLLQAPPQEIPLAASTREPRLKPIAFPAEVNPEEPMAPRSANPMAPISEYPGINPHYLSGTEHPELSGRVPTAQGVLIRPAPVASGAAPSSLPNPISSLRPARQGISSAIDKAAQENTQSVHGQLQPMQDFLGRRFATGEEIPENVTPRDLLNLKRGFSKEFLGRWNPDVHQEVTNVGRGAYHALDSEFDKAVPMAADANQRISSLIPVLRAADKAERSPSLFQRAAGRVAAHTGALTVGAGGAVAGYHEGGVPGAIAGGTVGVLGPEILASPEAQMLLARSLHGAEGLKPAVGGLLQINRKQKTGTEGTQR